MSGLFADDHQLNGTLTCTGGVEVDEVDESELTEVELAVVDNDGLAAADDGGAKVRVGIVAASCILVVLFGKLESLRTGMEIHALLALLGRNTSKASIRSC